MNKIYTFVIGVLMFAFVGELKVNAQCSTWIPRDSVFGNPATGDTTFSYVPFAYDSDGAVPVAPYYRNDDGVTKAIVLPFHFCFWGRMMDSVYINNNGNISFGQQYSSFLSDPADTFPLHNYEMIAPFWADVYTRTPATPGSNVVIYKIQAHYMIVQWDSVAYYAGETTKFNSFQVIISDGTDPIIPAGNNVSFAYRQMQWTTGDASGGTNGFGGHPAIVGGNQGDDVRYLRIGMFASAGTSYFGQFPPGPNYDEVGWLDNRSFLFNLCSGSIAPLVSGISPCDTFKICEGDSISIPLEYFSVIQGDTSWSNLVTPVETGVSITSNHPGPIDSLTIEVVGSAANAGSHTINLYGYDNQHPSDTTYTSFVIDVETPPNITLSTLHDSICAGGTATLTAGGGTTYSWSTGGTSSTINVSPTSSETYTVGVSNGGCVKDTTVKVDVLPAPSPSILITPNSACQGDSVWLVASGGTTYQWSTTQTTDSIKVVATLTTTVYTLTASNGTCAGLTTATVTAIPKTTATMSVTDSVVCPNSSTTITVNASNSSSTYKWSSGQTTSSITVNDSVTTTYTATVYGVCDTFSLVKTITVVPLPEISLTGNSSPCAGSKDTVTISSSTNPTTYLWSNGSTSTSYYTGDITGDSTITVTAKNSAGCTATAVYPITEKNYPVVTITPPASACSGAPVTLTATTAGAGPYNYTWLPSGTGNTSSVTVTLDSSSTYTVIVSNGCTTTKKITITPDVPTLSACCPATILLGGDTTITTTGNVVKYIWSPDNGLNCDTCADVVATPTVTTTYTVVGTDPAGCLVTSYVTIIVETPCFDPTVPNVFTPGFAGQNTTSSGQYGPDNVFYINTNNDNLSSWSLTIFDRWGKEMYNSTNPKQYWSGTTEGGSAAPAGVYYYVISATCQSNTYKKDGFVQLIR